MNDRFKFRVWDKISKRYFFLELKFGDNGYHSRFIEKPDFEQCTGLKDKNGKLIYENDYVKYKGNIYKVFWNKTKISLENILNNDIIDIQEFDYMEIIGNEHENGNIEKV